MDADNLETLRTALRDSSKLFSLIAEARDAELISLGFLSLLEKIRSAINGTEPKQSKAIRYSAKQARELLGCGQTHLYELSQRDIFTLIRPNGTGRGKRTYYLPDEIKLWAETADVERLRRYRKDKGRIEDKRRKKR